MKIRFMSLASGSSGNCYFLGTEDYGILIDAGIGIRKIKSQLKEINVELSDIKGVFITHDHADHIKAVGKLGEKENIPIYTTEGVHQGLHKSKCVSPKLTANSKKIIEKGKVVEINDIKIVAFETPHNGTDNMGYRIKIGGSIFVFITDFGCITPTIKRYTYNTDYLIIEANYDCQMLENGRYPQHLKDRVASDYGHMSNKDTGAFLAENYNERLKYVFLCHLSEDNNHPEIAYKTIEHELNENNIFVGKDLEMLTLKRYTSTELFCFDSDFI